MRIARIDFRWCVLGFERVLHRNLEALASEQGYRVGSVCNALGVSETHFREVFLRDVGVPPKLWMRWERMVVARRMLRWGCHPEMVAERLGFADANSFRREFLGIYGIQPLLFQKLRFRTSV